MIKFFRKYKPLFLSYIISFIAVVGISLFIPIRFSSYKKTDALSDLWYRITTSGDFVNILILIALSSIILCLVYFFKFGKLLPALQLTAAFIFTLISISFLNHAMIKNIFAEQRPSVIYIERSKEIVEHDTALAEVNPYILKAWQKSIDYSFPSGHSLISNFTAIFFSFMIIKVFPARFKYFFLIPLLWALLVTLSRVVIGIHYPSDIITGSVLGISGGFIFLFLISAEKFFPK